MATIDVKFTATIQTEELTGILERLEQTLQENNLELRCGDGEPVIIEAPHPSCTNPRE